MTARRITLYILLLLLLASTATIAYLYLHLPDIISTQGRAYLGEYGVESIETTQPQLTLTKTYLDRLTVRGEEDAYRFSATLEGIDLGYSTASLIRGELKDIAVERINLHLELKESTTADGPATDITLTELLPASVADLVPARSLTIGDIQLQLTQSGQPPVMASGSLNIGDLLHAKMAIPWQGLKVAVSLMVDESPVNTDITLNIIKGNTQAVDLYASSSLTQAGQWLWQARANIHAGPLRDWLVSPQARTALPIDLHALDELDVGGNVSLTGSLQHGDRFAPSSFTQSLFANLEFESDDSYIKSRTESNKVQGEISGKVALVPQQTRLSLSELDTRFVLGGIFQGNTLPLVSGSVSLTADSNSTQALKLQLAEPTGTLTLSLSGSGLPLQGVGNYRLQGSIDQLTLAANQYTPLLPAGSDAATLPLLRAGSSSLTSNIEARGWESLSAWQWRSLLDISDLAFTYDTYTVDGLSLRADWHGLEQWQTATPITVTADQVNTGFPLEHLSASISMPSATPLLTPNLQLERLEMSVFAGRAYLPQPQNWDFASPENSLVLQVEELALAEIVALQQNRQISANGRLSGRLPFTISGNRVTIDSGHLSATAPGGIIRYRADEASEALAGNSRELGMALTLLRNFHYDILSSEVALDDEGKLLLGLSLAGRNPDYEGGQAVNFNINLEQNIDPLLQSLRLSGSVVEQLEKKRR